VYVSWPTACRDPLKGFWGVVVRAKLVFIAVSLCLVSLLCSSSGKADPLHSAPTTPEPAQIPDGADRAGEGRKNLDTQKYFQEWKDGTNEMIRDLGNFAAEINHVGNRSVTLCDANSGNGGSGH
jgi:hypothetical protein